MDPREILKAADQAAWVLCDPSTSSPAQVEELGIIAVRALRESYAAGDNIRALIAMGTAQATHRAMVCRGMHLDALDLFSRLNAAAVEISGNSLLGDMTYTEYVEDIIRWFTEDEE